MRKFGLIAGLVAGLGVAEVAQATDYNGYEIPKYTVLQSDGSIELRQYAPHIVAEVTVTGSRRDAANTGFRLLAGYIFGGNTSSDKLAMTAPVTQAASEKINMTAPVTQIQSGDTWTIRFMMPSTYTLDTLPKPNSDTVQLRVVDPGTRLVMQFSGRAMAGNKMASYEDRLRSYANTNNIPVTGPAEAAYYDDPFTLPWKRRNEVSLAVK